MPFLLWIFVILLLPCAVAAGGADIAKSAKALIGVTVNYTPQYVKLDYPMGDVPMQGGVCSDVVVRALRGAGLDLQQLIHEDMSGAFASYPQIWGASKPDYSIDHRRVPNIIKYFERTGETLPLPVENANIRVGDIIAWRLPSNLTHIGIITYTNGNYSLITHNIGSGAQEEDVLRSWEIIAHIRVNQQ
jgi:uncharacterized protein YijF (DUF1287 family)